MVWWLHNNANAHNAAALSPRNGQFYICFATIKKKKYFSENCKHAGFGSGKKFSVLNMEELFFFLSQDLFFLVYIRKFRIENWKQNWGPEK